MRIVIQGENADIVHLKLYCSVLLNFSITVSFLAVHTQIRGESDE